MRTKRRRKVCNGNSQEAETGRSPVQDQPRLYRKTLSQEQRGTLRLTLRPNPNP